jgi:DNA-binding PadR family transcriptional regulator
MNREITACPDCDASQIKRRTGTDFGGREPETPGQYRCEACGARFDDPVTRAARSGQGLGGLAQRLADADPDDVSADDEQLVTDGGRNAVPLYDLTAFQRDLLWIAWALDAPSGQEIKRRIEDEAGVEEHHARLYPNLDSLVADGLLDKRQRDRRTNEYPLTDQGRRLLRERASWQQAQRSTATRADTQPAGSESA